jgi:hypothetical protein
MRRLSLKAVRVLARRTVLLILLAGATAPAAASAAPPGYYPSGPQKDVLKTALTDWTLCYQGDYRGGASIEDIQAGCDGDYILMASAPVGATKFDVVAAAPRGDVYTDTENTAPHEANGTAWYFSGYGAWGFAPAGAAINLAVCDTVDDNDHLQTGGQGDLRTCWETYYSQMESGGRSGRTVLDYASGLGYERFLYESSGATVPAPACDTSLGPVGCWGFDETSGTTAADATANANNGTYFGSPALGAAGVFGTAVTMDGVNDYVRVADSNSLDVGNALTLEGWVKRASTSKTDSLFNKGANAFQLVALSAASGGRVLLRKAGVSTVAQSTTGVPADGAFHHVVATKAGNVVHIYIDGADVTQAVAPSLVLANNTQPLYFSETAGDRVTGKFDAFAIYGRALTATEVAGRYAAGHTAPPT